MIKVLHYGLSKNPGGIEGYLFKVWNNIDKGRYEFSFVDMHEGKACYRERLEQECRFYNITNRRKKPLKNFQDWNRILKEEDIDIVHFHFNTLSDIMPVIIALKYEKKVIVHSRSAQMSRSLFTAIMHRINFVFLPRKKIKMVAVSEKAGIWLFGRRAKFEILNNGVDVQKYRYCDKEREAIRKQYNLQGKYVIGNVGVFLRGKNQRFVVDVFQQFLREREVALVLIGGGEMEESIMQYAESLNVLDKTLFLGKRDDVHAWYSAMDLLVFPSFFEGFPNVILEAQTSGLNCIISDVITDEVVIQNNVKKCSLKKPANIWKKEAEGLDVNVDRDKAWKKIVEKGLSVECEIKKLEAIYTSIMQ